MVYSRLDTLRFCCSSSSEHVPAIFISVQVCIPSKTRLNWLQTVIDGQKVDEPWTKCRNPTNLDWTGAFCTRRSGSSQLASDKILLKTACPGTELHCKPTRSVDQLCEMCLSSTLHSPTHCSNDVSVDTVIGFSEGGSEANVTFERQRLHGEGGEGHDCRNRGPKASKEETETTNDDRGQHWSGIQSDDQLGNSNAQRNFDTTITSVLSDNSSVAPICCGHPPERRSQTGKCSDDGRGPVKRRCQDAWHGNFSEVHRWSMLVFQKQIQTVLDAADR